MYAIRSSSVVLLTILIAMLFARPTAGRGADGTPALVAGNTEFALDLYSRLKSADGNLFFSPYSISTCLAMTYAGARGSTATQMARALHFGDDREQLASAFGELQSQLGKAELKPGIELNVANGMWGQQDHPFRPAFLDTAAKAYQAKLAQVDFRTRAEPAREAINDWVSKQTRGKITDLLQRGAVDAATRLVLVNAIYFKGTWARQFQARNTANAPFSVTAQSRVQAPLMNLTAEFKYAEVEGLQLLELPYAGDDLAMVVLLPRATGGLASLESQLNAQALAGWLARAHSQKVNVFLPKFKLTAQFSLGKTLAALGMTDAFTTKADFSGMDGARDLYVSAVVHKAFVDVNEEGTEAAAATGTMMTPMAVVRPVSIPVFRADHPFLFLIRATHSGSILFLGRVVNPTRA